MIAHATASLVRLDLRAIIAGSSAARRAGAASRSDSQLRIGRNPSEDVGIVSFSRIKHRVDVSAEAAARIKTPPGPSPGPVLHVLPASLGRANEPPSTTLGNNHRSY